ncbi:MAG: hypothetical protein AAF483_03790 [Planctomycetota bacterium]
MQDEQTDGDGDDIPPIVNEPMEVGSENPFAPSVAELTEDLAHGAVRTNMPGIIWLVFALTLVLFVALTFFMGLSGVWAVAALIGGMIRLPFWQRAFTKRHPEKSLPNPLASLAASFVFVLLAWIASFLCFAVICVPTVFLTSGINASSTTITVISCVSGAIGLIVFSFLCFLSLRLPI